MGCKVEDWVGEVTRLEEFARFQPQASYAAFTFGQIIKIIIIITRIFIQDNLSVLIKRTVIKRVL